MRGVTDDERDYRHPVRGLATNSFLTALDRVHINMLQNRSARLTAEQTAWLLNCKTHDIPVLVNSRLIKPLGHPPLNSGKFFATTDLLEASKDRNWLVRVTTTICQHWQKKNNPNTPKKNLVENGTSGEALTQEQNASAN